MEKRFTFATYILVLLLMIGLIVNLSLLIVILLVDTFLMTDVITAAALILITLSMIGIFCKQKWGAVFAIAKSMFDIILRLWFFSLGYTDTLIFIVLTLVLAIKEYQHIDTYWLSVTSNSISYP